MTWHLSSVRRLHKRKKKHSFSEVAQQVISSMINPIKNYRLILHTLTYSI